MAAHELWRLVITDNNGSVVCIAVSQFQLRDTIGVASESIGYGSYADSELPGNESYYSRDDDPDTEWKSNVGVTSTYLQYDYYVDIPPYPSVIDPASYVVGGGADATQSPKDFQLQYYDDDLADWVTHDTRTGETGWGSKEQREYTFAVASVDGDVQISPFTVDGLFDVVDGDYFGSIPLSPYTLLGTAGIGNDGASRIPLFTLSASDLQGPNIVGHVNLGAPTGLADAFAVTPYAVDAILAESIGYDGDIVISATLLPGSSWVVSGIMSFGTFAIGDVELPSLSVEGISIIGEMATGDVALLEYSMIGGSLEPAIELPLYEVDGACISGSVGAGAAITRYLRVDATGLTGTMSSGDVELPLYDAAGGDGQLGAAVFEEFTLDASGYAGIVADGSLLLRDPELLGTMLQSTFSSGDIALVVYTSTGTVTSGSVASGGVTLDSYTLTATELGGCFGVGQITVPLVTLSATGYSSTIGSATITIPMYAVDGVLTAEVAAPVFTSIVLNTRTNAVTNYSEVTFNSLCSFNGVILAATDAGIVALTGQDDAGEAISARLKVGATNFGSSAQKRVLAGYVGYRASGELQITMITDDHHEFIYRLEPRQTADVLHPSRVKFGRGVKGVYSQWQLENVDGADFELNSLILDVDTLTRRT